MNPILKQAGFSPNDRVCIIHADDVGMCQASLAAFEDMLEVGLVTSGSTMVPCSWFPATAAFCRANPQVDMGVHITLTCEWDAYRWGPLSTRDPQSGLMDEEGYFPRTPQHIWEQADLAAALGEVDVQLARAAAAGIDITHAEDHMAALLHPRLFAPFIELLLRRGIPIRQGRPQPPQDGEGGWDAANREVLLQAAARGAALIDCGGGFSLDEPEGKIERAREFFTRMPPGGLSLLVGHPAQDTPELRAIAPDWRGRVADYQALMSRELKADAHRLGVQLIGFRQLRPLLTRPTPSIRCI